MMRSLILLAVLAVARGAEICCPELNACYNDDPPFDAMPLPHCQESGANPVQATLTMFTRDNPDVGQTVYMDIIPPVFDPAQITIFIAHGWTQSIDATWMYVLKDDLLSVGDYNVVVVGWEGGSQHILYPQSASDTRTTGATIGRTAENLVVNGGGARANMYCTGHSLGGHVCGHAGNTYKFGRLTGMDPAGPEFENHDWTVGINPGGADFVDIMHCDGDPDHIDHLGTMKILGHADFYPAGGALQPGCDGALTDETCSHVKCVPYYIESVRDPCFKSYQQCTDQYDLPGSCGPVQSSEFTSMGYPAANYKSATGIFYLDVNADAPHCVG